MASGTMQRSLQNRRERRFRFVWAGALLVALTFAVGSMVLTAWTWGQTRSLSLSFKTLQYHFEQVSAQREAALTLLLEKRGKLRKLRAKRESAGHPEAPAARDKKKKVGNGRRGKELQEMASHFEMNPEGIIKGWTEEGLNATKAVNYDPRTGNFKVEKRGVYFLYCQVHFNEDRSSYVKLAVSVDGQKVLQCVEGYGTTPSSGSHHFHFMKPCQVSGLLRLESGAQLSINTEPTFTLLRSAKHYFGLFRVT